jgi:16S rRNA (cytosine967-C5)-methyltransferase
MSDRRETAALAAPPAGMPARRSALDILTLVRGGESLDGALAACRSFEALVGPDRGFARALASTVLRRQGSLDALIEPYLERPLEKRAERAMDILRLAAAQTAVMGVADHAAVNTAVALAKSFKETGGYAKVVNAIARKVAKGGSAGLEKLPIRSDTPGWLWRSWERAYGPNIARAIAEAHRSEPPLDLTLKPGVEPSALAERLGGEVLPSGGVRLGDAGRIPEIDGFSRGDWWVQDAAASLPARLLGDVSGKTVFDWCAAPGGKTLQLAAAGARVLAVDIAGPRLKLIAENLQRTHLKGETIKADILAWSPPELADAILVDAPCSATGTIRRNPDILWRRQEEEVGKLAELQAKFIDRAVGALKPGGVLVYAACSLQPEEGERQAEAALARHPELSLRPVSAQEAGIPEAATLSGYLRTLPSMLKDKGGLDGFFAARFLKR